MNDRYRVVNPTPGTWAPDYDQASASRGNVAMVFGMLGFSFLFSIVGGFVGTALFTQVGVGLPVFMLLFVGQMIMLFSLRAVASRSAPLGLAMLYGFTFLSGLSLSPIIMSYIAAGMVGVVGQALFMTALLTFGLTVFGLTTEVSLAKMGTWLFVGLLGLIGASVLAIFFQSPMLQIAIGAGGAVLFSLFLVYDVQRIRQQSGVFANAVVLTASVYLDIINLFLSLLRLLGVMGGGSRRE